MIFGYNTDVKAGDNVYHVQTEDRGEKHPFIDSVIYHKGQILDRRRTKYDPKEVPPERVKEMVTQQHKELVESIRCGAYVPGLPADSMTVELLNGDSLEQDGLLLFHLKVPSGTKVEAFMETDNADGKRAEAISDESGEAHLTFPLPEQQKATVLVRAVTDLSMRTLKFVVHRQ
jgi:hypothetical protein